MEGPKKCLIIEDDQAIAELERDYLEINGFACKIIANGIKGMEEALQGDYAIIILDLMLPEVDGFEICRRIREVKHMPILMVSARKEDIDKIRGLGLGADDYLTKPFSPNELVARVKSHLSRYERLLGLGQIKKTEEIRIRGLEIQVDARRVLVHGQEILLTTKEFDLLLFLAKNPDHVFTKESLLDKVWGIDHFGDSATVTVHVGKLRDKLENQPGESQYIETVWGVGYRFKA